MEIEYCTKCKKRLDDIKIEINFNIKVHTKKESGIWEYIPNLDNNSKEVLCMDCFDEFSNLMYQLNNKYEKK